MSFETADAAIERAVTLDILRGRYPSGSRLPTVRELAGLHRVTPATIQRVVARLETRGLVEARQGSGLRVNDPRESGDIALVPYWLAATLDQPARALSILGDFLEVRRIVAVRLLVRHREAVLARVAELQGAAERLLAASSIDEIRRADLAFARALLAATDNVVALSVLNTLGDMLEHLPALAAAMYAKPSENAKAMVRVLRALAGKDKKVAEAIEQIMADVDARTVARFATSLRRKS